MKLERFEQLRDGFAAAALTGLLAGRKQPDEFDPAGAAVFAYHFADAMLLQRRAYCPLCHQKLDPDKGFIVHESGCLFGWPDAPSGM